MNEDFRRIDKVVAPKRAKPCTVTIKLAIEFAIGTVALTVTYTGLVQAHKDQTGFLRDHSE